MTLGWGIVGTGMVADTAVAPGIAKLENSTVVASVDVDPARAQAFAEKHGGRALGDFEELLADPDVDVVYIATPNALHAAQVVAAAEAGKHVFVDKPLATSVEDAYRAVEACARAGVTLGIDFQTRRHVGMDDVRETIVSGGIGDVLVVQCEVSSGPRPLGSWRADPKLARLGTINNVGVHAYDLLRHILGSEIVEVTTLTNASRGELETTALALLRFENGALAYVNANQIVPDYQADLVVYGTEGRIVGRSITRPFLEHGTIAISARGKERTIETQSKDAYDRTVAAFARAVVAGEPFAPSGEDGLRSVELTEAMARSLEQGVTVKLEVPARA